MMRPLKRTLRSRCHFSSLDVAKNETNGGKISGSHFLSFCAGYFLAGPYFFGKMIKKRDEKIFKEVYGESAKIDDVIMPGIGESLWYAIVKPIWTKMRE